jgi:hypothetical protein
MVDPVEWSTSWPTVAPSSSTSTVVQRAGRRRSLGATTIAAQAPSIVAV